MNDILVLQNIRRTYKTGSEALTVLDGAALTLRQGEIVALVAPSGSGKSTLLHLAGLLEKPDDGAVLINGQDAGTLSDAARTKIRLSTIGIVYQFHHLLPEFTALENVTLPQMIAGKSRPEAERRSLRAADQAWPGGTGQPPARQIVRRRTAARRHCPGARQQSVNSAGGRADRKSRRAHRRHRVR